ncbi:phosphoglucosamine mutase [Caloranaerobacter azorensis H53214]|uniref:Phosphoglucosamine mutase n=1 Tax=Caloranaerobacter azorensis H53214 TaxID=1156417 RepID=A0A096CSV1_9FIRM|nr:phosphoglucosamine mutase [Caloranaerobacter azorensis]KGG79594.1 phosphoglucosamine mutase [Caloranaerobacter azorensis H53214]
MGRLFGTDGVRGVANKELTPELAFKLGRIGAYILTKGKKDAKIVVGMDTRISGDMLEAALISGICSVGVDVLSVGIIPTPGVAYLTREYNADAGVVISASHNPVEYNGIKFFNSKGYKLNDEVERDIEEIILNNSEIPVRPIGENVGRVKRLEDGQRKYIDFLKSTVDVDLKGLKIAMDCGNGAAYKIAPTVFEELGAEVVVIHNMPNGVNINVDCGSTNPNQVQKLVLETGADIGLSFDGDADRLIAVDEEGKIVDGDHIMAICGIALKERNKLKGNTVVATVMSNMGLDICLKEKGIEIVKTKVGDRYVIEEMLSKDYSLGGEQSGHIIFLDYNTTGDGVLTALQLTSVVKNKGKKLSKLAKTMTTLPQVLINAKVPNDKKKKYLEDEIIRNEIEKIEKGLKDTGRVLIRPSGTEPLVRVMIEGKDEDEIKKMAEELANLIEERLN